jgi:glycosyltransferase involved in cell wall biosynthesis
MTGAGSAPLVAIVTPVYNGGELLAETLESVQNQTYQNLVHCILDNASTDATAEVIARFKDRRVPLITARNLHTLPQIANWNAALQLVPHDAAYFRILAADDRVAPQCLAKTVALGQQYPQAGLIACQELVNDMLMGADLPSNRALFDGRAIVRASLLRTTEFPFMNCLYRYPRSGIPLEFYVAEFYGTKLLCSDADAAMRELSRSHCAYVHEPLMLTRWPGPVTSAEVIPNHVGIWSWLQLIDRWGPTVFDTKSEYIACRRRYLQNYYLHLLLWRLQRKTGLLERHADWLRRAAALPTALDYAHAVVAWPILRTLSRLRQIAARITFPAHRYQID